MVKRWIGWGLIAWGAFILYASFQAPYDRLSTAARTYYRQQPDLSAKSDQVLPSPPEIAPAPVPSPPEAVRPEGGVSVQVSELKLESPLFKKPSSDRLVQVRSQLISHYGRAEFTRYWPKIHAYQSYYNGSMLNSLISQGNWGGKLKDEQSRISLCQNAGPRGGSILRDCFVAMQLSERPFSKAEKAFVTFAYSCETRYCPMSTSDFVHLTLLDHIRNLRTVSNDTKEIVQSIDSMILMPFPTLKPYLKKYITEFQQDRLMTKVRQDLLEVIDLRLEEQRLTQNG